MNIIRSITNFSVDKVDRLCLFSFMWAIAMLFHQFIYFYQWLYTVNLFGIALTISAILLFIRPQSIILLLAMLIMSVSYGINRLPFLSNHIFFQWSVDFLLLLSIGWVLFRHLRKNSLRTIDEDRDYRNQIFESFAPLARIALIVLYFFAVFHKLNWGFLDIKYSHGAKLLQEMSGLMPFIPINDATKWFSVYSTLIFEGAIPILLCFRRTRNVGIVFAILFHLILCLNPQRPGFSSFTSMLFALFFLYTPEDFPQRLKDQIAGTYRKVIEGKAKWIIIFLIIFILIFLAVCLVLIYYKQYKSIAVVFLVGYGLLFAALFSLVIFKRQVHPVRNTNYFHLRSIQWLGVLLLLFNGMCPYLGLKTFATFNMFTNLRTEGGHTNHIFMPLINLGHYQEDLVEILKTNHPKLKKYAPQKQMITYFEFQRIIIKSHADYYVDYKRNGILYNLEENDQMEGSSLAMEKHGWWTYKLLGFKPVDYGPHCMH